MRFGKVSCMVAVVLFVTLVLPDQMAGQQHLRYKLVVMDTFGGPNSFSFFGDAIPLNNRGVVVGQADTAIPDPNFENFNPYVGQDPFLQHAFKWENGTVNDLGALPGPNTSLAGFIMNNGQIAGVSTRSTLDPLTGWPEEAAILWRDGEMIDLGTLGGYEAQADANNSRGQVAGFSANTVPDSLASPICPSEFTSPIFPCFPLPSWGTQQRAFLWQNGVMQDLGDLGGPDAVALLINESGQIAGQGYTSSTPNPATGVPTVDPFFWENGKMIDLGGFGGTFGVTSWLSERGQVVGNSNLPGDLITHPFLWDRGVLTDLGTLGGTFGTATQANDKGEVVGYATTPGDQLLFGFLWKNGIMTNLGTLDGDCFSSALAINTNGQIVGHSNSCDDIFRAVTWVRGSIIDLNVFVPPGEDLELNFAGFISDRGEILGTGILPSGNTRAFLLIPCGEGEAGCKEATTRPVTHSTAPGQISSHQGGLMGGVRVWPSRYHALGFTATRH